MDFIAVSLFNGVSYGLLIFMVSAGLTLVFGMMGVLNIAHAAFYMIGAYVGYWMTMRGSFWAGLVLATLVAAAIGAVVERVMLRRAHKHGHAHELLLTFGLLFIFEELVKILFGFYPVNYSAPDSLTFTAFSVFGTNYPFYRLFIGLVAVFMFSIVFFLLRFTRAGLIVRASVYRPQMVEALGHNVPMVFLGVFSLGAGMAGLAGAVAGAFYPTSPTMAQELGMIIFVVVVVGGLGSIHGALVASLLIGVMSSFAVGVDWTLADALRPFGAAEWLTGASGILTVRLSSLAGALPFLFMLITLLVRPAGLFGDKSQV